MIYGIRNSVDAETVTQSVSVFSTIDADANTSAATNTIKVTG